MLMLGGAAGKKSGGCTAKALWPDGREEERTCIIEGEGKGRGPGADRGSIGSSFAWMKDTRWNWNNWRDVVFRADGSFLAPAESCEVEGNPACQWYTNDDDEIVVKFGGAGIHRLTADASMRELNGYRESDGDTVVARRR
eukprot:scaffold142026_cov28-Tisochrysis_lutea.AAC.1